MITSHQKTLTYVCTTGVENKKLRDELSKAILKLEEDNVLNTLYSRWWKQGEGANDCKDQGKNSDGASPLEIANVGGVFVMLVGGLVISLLVGFVEFFFYVIRHPNKDKVGSRIGCTIRDGVSNNDESLSIIDGCCG